MFLIAILILTAYAAVLYWIYSVMRKPKYHEMLAHLAKEYPNCRFVILYGARSKRPYAFTFDPKLSILLIVDMESFNRFSVPPEAMRESAMSTEDIPEFELIEYIKEKLNVLTTRYPNSN